MTVAITPETKTTLQAPPKVLIVDDDDSTRTLLRAVLKDLPHPCDIEEAADADSALAIAASSRPDLVLLDIVLPGSSSTGVLVCQELCKDSRTLVVIISGTASNSILNTCLSMGAIESIRKPFSTDQLRDKLARWLT